MKHSKGFTLIEMAVVLAIIAILAAILTPIVTGYIDQARTTRANEDVVKIQSAFLLHYRDTSRFPIWDTTTVANTGTTPSKNCLVSGTTAVLPSGGTNDASWAGSAGCSGASIGIIRNYLNVNSLGVATGNPGNGAIAYRGPYLDGLDASDPWGQPYVVVTKYLSTSGANTLDWAFAVSAGPNGQLDTVATQARTTPLATGSDDITSLIR